MLLEPAVCVAQGVPLHDDFAQPGLELGKLTIGRLALCPQLVISLHLGIIRILQNKEEAEVRFVLVKS